MYVSIFSLSVRSYEEASARDPFIPASGGHRLGGIWSNQCHSTEHVDISRIVKARLQTLENTAHTVHFNMSSLQICVFLHIIVNVNLCGSLEGHYISMQEGISLNVMSFYFLNCLKKIWIDLKSIV